MDYDNGFILQKEVNWSLLNEGLAIPISVCSRFSEWDASILQHGTCKQVKILIDNEFYDAKLINQNFDKRKYPDHRDIIQIRYRQIHLSPPNYVVSFKKVMLTSTHNGNWKKTAIANLCCQVI